MITEDTLTSLRSNDERLDNLFVYLDDYTFGGDEDDVSLLEALRHNTCVTAVDCDMHLDELAEPLQKFMTGVGLLQNLQSLRCSSSGDYAITMAALALALQANHHSKTTEKGASKGTHLTTLDLANFLLLDPVGCKERPSMARSYQEFVDALRYHPALTSFHLGFGFASSSMLCPAQELENQTPPDSAGEAHCTLTPLLESVMTLPRLSCVRLDGAGFAPQTALTPKGLSILCSCSSSLTSLEVQDFDVSPDHLEAVARALGTNTSLKTLSLCCKEFSSNGSSSGERHRSAISSLAQALRTNSHLVRLHLSMYLVQIKPKSKSAKQQDDALMEFFHALESNHSLKKLQITGKPLNAIGEPITAQAFRHMLLHNYGLESIQIAGFAEWDEEIQLHTHLNSMGRGQLVRNTNATTRHQWMEVLGRVRDDLSCLFHLLLLNPLLCSSSSSSSSSSNGTAAMERSG